MEGVNDFTPLIDDGDGDDCGPCRICGCTNDDCRQCIERTGYPCSWVEVDLCSACAAAGEEMAGGQTPGCALIADERCRQIVIEGHTPERDDMQPYYFFELCDAAEAYLVAKDDKEGTDSRPDSWPWGSAHWNPKGRLSNLVRAGALIAAAIDCELRRRQREAAKAGED